MSIPMLTYPAPAPTVVQVRRNSNRKRNKGSKNLNPSPTALVYRGPTRAPQGMQSNDVITVQLGTINSISSGGTGVINTVFDSYNQANAASDWANFAAAYREFRILSMNVSLVPWNKYNLPTSATVIAAPIYSVVDRNDNSSLASLAATASYSSVKNHEPSTRFSRVVKMQDDSEAEWVSTGSSPGSTSRMFIKLYSAGNTASTTYYDYLDILMVQFRGRV